MFAAKDVIGDAVTRANVLLAGHQRGDVVPWAAIETAAGFERETTHWPQFLKRVRRDCLRERGIKLAAVAGVGLKFMTHEEQLHDQSRQRRACRQMSRGLTELRALPDAELSDHQRDAKARKIDVARVGRGKVIAAIRVGFQLARPTTGGLPRARPVGV